MKYDIDGLLFVYTDITLARGRQYYRAGHVIALERHQLPGGTLIRAQVQGSGRSPYVTTMKFDLDGEFLSSSCTCPLQGDCKHEVAMLLALQAQQEEQEEPAGASAQQVLTGQNWLAGMQRALEQKAKPSPECLVYMLNESALPAQGLCLQLFKTRELQKGGYSRPKPYTNYGYIRLAEERPVFVRDNDVPVLLAIRAHDGEYRNFYTPNEVLLKGPSGYAVLMAAIATGRCYWQSMENSPLRVAEKYRTSIVWKEQKSGLGTALAEWPTDWLLMTTSPPLALDNQQHCVHPVETGLPEQLAEMVLAAPVLPAPAWSVLWPTMREIFGQAALPLPPQVRAPQEINDLVPVPCLHFFCAPMLQRGKKKMMPMARLRARYGAYEVLPQKQDGYLSVTSGDNNLLIHRNPSLEARWRQEVLPMQTLSVLLGWQAPSDERGQDYGLRAESEWPDFMQNTVVRLVNRGWQVSFADDFPWRIQVLDAATWHGDLSDSADRNGWFSLGLDVELEGEKISLVPLLVSALDRLPLEDQQKLVQEDAPEFLHVLHGQRVLKVPVARVRPLLNVLVDMFGRVDPQLPVSRKGELRLNRLEAARVAAATEVQWKSGSALRELGARLENFSGLETVPVPSSFHAQLRPYQQTGLDWLQFLRTHQLGGVLADDMGLGKTVQTLAHVLVEKEKGRLNAPALIVCPKSLLPNWRAEAARFAPSLRVLCITGTQRKALLDSVSEHDLVITTYPLLARDIDVLMQQKFAMCVCDEAQQLKNHKTQMARAVRDLEVEQRLALTGTPMENHLGELWSLFDWLQPGYLGSEAEFRRRIRNPVEKDGNRLAAERLSRRIRPFMLRRTKQEVVKELPAKTEILQSVEISGAQRDLYETVRATMDTKVRAVIAKKGLARSSIEILEALLKLRQVCCDPRLLGESGDKVGSAKLDLLLDLLPELIEDGRRILLFSQFTSMLALIEAAVTARGIPYVKLTGQTRDRELPVTRFQQGEVPLFLISLKAGGSGLNLTAADTVIHYDPWWNPAVEQQATDRAHRIGQDKPVFVYKLICEGTLEERMLALQARKAALAAGVYGSDAGFDGGLDSGDLQALLSPLGE